MLHPQLWWWLILCGCLPLATQAQTPPPLLLAEEYQADLALRLYVAETAHPLQADWLALELDNLGTEALRIERALVRIELRAYQRGQQSPFLNQTIQLAEPTALFGQRGGTALATGQYPSSPTLCSLVGAALGFPPDGDWQVKAWLHLDLQLRGAASTDTRFEWAELEWNMNWRAPEAVALHRAEGQLVDLLHHPGQGRARAERVRLLLQNPQLRSANSPEYLLNALRLRAHRSPERHVLVDYLHRHYATREVVVQHFRRQLHQKDFLALQDLREAPAVWSTQFLEPLIGWFQSGNSAALVQIMETLYAHRHQWINQPGIATIFSDLLLYRYVDLLDKQHYELDDRQLLQWCSAARLLGQTGNPELRERFCPFLSCQKTWPESEVCFPAAAPELYPPESVADLALEALLQLDQDDLYQYYRTWGYEVTGDAVADRERLRQLRRELSARQGFACRAEGAD
ncbi:MAG: hypothetical protein AAFW73_05765 [Bacteroidota bacterium]